MVSTLEQMQVPNGTGPGYTRRLTQKAQGNDPDWQVYTVGMLENVHSTCENRKILQYRIKFLNPVLEITRS